MTKNSIMEAQSYYMFVDLYISIYNFDYESQNGIELPNMKKIKSKYILGEILYYLNHHESLWIN